MSRINNDKKANVVKNSNTRKIVNEPTSYISHTKKSKNISGGDNKEIKKKNISDNISNCNSIQSISQHEDRPYDTVPFRLDFLKDILQNNKLEPIIEINDVNTECFVHPNGYDCEEKDAENHDIRSILNKKTHDFYQVITQMGGKLTYIKSGSTGHTFRGSIKTDGSPDIDYAVKVVAYPKTKNYGTMYDVRRPENAELLMIRLLSYFIVSGATPHITLPIGTFYTNIEHFTQLIENRFVDSDNKKYKEFVEKYKKGGYYSEVSILISEWANRGDLLDFIRKNYREFSTLDWKVIFFQIISVLAVIQSKFPSFRHNDMKANNILIHKVEKRGTLFSYTICHNKYYVKNIGYRIKLWDFDFACIPGVVENFKVDAKWTSEINVKPEQNRYYDIHYFFNTLIKKGFFPALLTDPNISDEIKEFVNRVVPKKYQYGKKVKDEVWKNGEKIADAKYEIVSERGRLLLDDEYLIPNDILMKDPLFEEFRNYKPKKTIKK
jgi:hypothetical protein